MMVDLAQDVGITHQPTVSPSWVMREYPDARAAERDALVQLAACRPGDRIVDLQAADGYVANEIGASLGWNCELICVESTKALNCRIDKRCRVVEDPLDRLSSLDEGTINRVVGLAGLHHSPSIQRTIQEVFRILTEDGVFAVCDVEDGSSVAHWLNEFVDQHNPLGHKGRFFQPGELTSGLSKSGFSEIKETRCHVPWRFDSRASMTRFFKGLFGLVADERQVLDGINEYLSVRDVRGGCEVDWTLIFARGRKLVGSG